MILDILLIPDDNAVNMESREVNPRRMPSESIIKITVNLELRPTWSNWNRPFQAHLTFPDENHT